MTAVSQLMTAEELFRMRDDAKRHELVRGELKTYPWHGAEHGFITATIAASLHSHTKESRSGGNCVIKVGCVLARNPDTVRAPDIAIIDQKRVEETGNLEGYWPGAPDLLIDIVEPYDLYTEVQAKVVEWLEAGARMVVVVNPRNRSAAVHRSQTDVVILTQSDVLDGGDVVPGWKMPIKEMFE